MLNVDDLQKALQKSFEEVLEPAFEQAFKNLVPETTDDGNKKAKEWAKTIKELISEPLSIRLSEAIDAYIKNATIYGTLMTTGSPSVHTCTINSPSPITNGVVQNTLGIR